MSPDIVGQGAPGAPESVQRLWMPYGMAAKHYMGVDKSLLLGAIKRHELSAFEKPITKGRTTTNQAKQRHSYFVYLPDIDQWVRTHWARAFDNSPDQRVSAG